MTIFAVWIQPQVGGHLGARYIDSQWAQLDKAQERLGSLKACFKSFGVSHEVWIGEMCLADVEIIGLPGKKKEAA